MYTYVYNLAHTVNVTRFGFSASIYYYSCYFFSDLFSQRWNIGSLFSWYWNWHSIEASNGCPSNFSQHSASLMKRHCLSWSEWAAFWERFWRRRPSLRLHSSHRLFIYLDRTLKYRNELDSNFSFSKTIKTISGSKISMKFLHKFWNQDHMDSVQSSQIKKFMTPCKEYALQNCP